MRADDPEVLRPSAPSARDAPEVARELLARYRTQRPVRAMTVTDLLDPRQAYWRMRRPIPPDADQAARMRAGQALHERLGRLLAPPSSREVRVRRDEVVGRIDVLDGGPVELKSTESPPGPDDDPRRTRPYYVEQVAIYAAMVARPGGRLVVVGPGSPPSVAVWDLSVPDSGALWGEVASRARLLRSAHEAGSPLGLPRCAFYDRGCAYRRDSVCDCHGDEAPLGPEIVAGVGAAVARPQEAERVAALLAASDDAAPAVRGFRDLAYPRRGYFDAARADDLAGEEDTPSGEPDETWSALRALLDAAEDGPVEPRAPAPPEAPESVDCFRGEPCLVKTTRAMTQVPADRFPTDRPHYVLELGLRCGAVGASAGWIFLGLERVPSDGPWIRAVRIEFGAPAALRELVEARTDALRTARRSGDAGGLPNCPGWMFERCPHRAVCGCGGL